MEVQRDEQGNGVDAVSDTTKSKGDLDTQTVDEGAGEETNDGEGTVEGDVLRMWLASVYFRLSPSQRPISPPMHPRNSLDL